MRRTAPIIALAALLTAGAHAPDREAPPYPYVVFAPGGRFYFRMMTDPLAEHFDREKGSGGVYEVGPYGVDRVLWRIDGWYAFTTFLSSDGGFLVRLGNHPRGWSPSDSDLAVAFYRRGGGASADTGILLKSYSTRTLIEDDTKVEPTRSHYEFIAGIPGLVDPNGYIFELVTVDRIRYLFDIRTGEMIAKERGGTR